MIGLDRLTKSFPTRRGRKYVANQITATFPTGEAVALLGRNGAGKSTLLQVIAGNMMPDSGQILSSGTISYPVAFNGAFHPDLTGAQNARFLARIYGVDTEALLEFVLEFSELGDYFQAPVRTYSSGMRSRLSFGVSMAIDFDTYLVDEVTSVGDRNFREKSAAVFHDRMKGRSAVVVTHSLAEVRNLCTSGAVLEKGHLRYFHDLEDAIEVYTDLMERSKYD